MRGIARVASLSICWAALNSALPSLTRTDKLSCLLAEFEVASLRLGDPGIRRGDSATLLDRFVFENASPVAFKLPIGFAFEDDSLDAFEPSALLTKYSSSAPSSLVVPALLLYSSSAEAFYFS